MKTHRRLTQALVLLLALLISGTGAVLPRVASAAQTARYTYVSNTTGQTVAWDGPWAYDDQGSSTAAGSEVVVLSSDIAITMLGFLPTGINMNQARDQVLAEFQKNAASFKTLDRGSYSNVSYSLDLASLADGSGQETDFGVFTLFLGNAGNGATEVQIFMAPVQVFTQGMNSAKRSITVGGAAILNGVTPGGLQNLLDRSAGTATNRNANQGSSDQTGSANDNGLNLGGNDGTPSRGSAGTKRSRATDSYTDPTYGYSVEWAAGWESKESSSGLTLTSEANGAIVLFDGVNTNGNSVVNAADRFPSAYVESDKLLQNARLGASTVGDDSITFVVFGTINGVEVAEVVELIDQPDLASAVMIRVVAPQSAGTSVARAVQKDVTVNGQPVLRDLNDLVDNSLDAPSG